MPNFIFSLHKYDFKKRLNRQQVLVGLAPTLVKVNDLMPLRQEFSNSVPKIFGVEYTVSTLVDYALTTTQDSARSSGRSVNEVNCHGNNTKL